MATILGKESIYISTDHIGLYEKYGYDFLDTRITVSGEESRIYTKALSVSSEEKNIRMEKGSKWEAEIVGAAKKDFEYWKNA